MEIPKIFCDLQVKILKIAAKPRVTLVRLPKGLKINWPIANANLCSESLYQVATVLSERKLASAVQVVFLMCCPIVTKGFHTESGRLLWLFLGKAPIDREEGGVVA